MPLKIRMTYQVIKLGDSVNNSIPCMKEMPLTAWDNIPDYAKESILLDVAGKSRPGWAIDFRVLTLIDD